MPEQSPAAVVEDITEMTWEDLVLELGDSDGPDINVATAGSTAGTATIHSSAGGDTKFI